MDEYLATYSFYDEKGRRLGIFGKSIAGGKLLHVFVVTCSPKDRFKKTTARMIFEGRITNGTQRGRDFMVDIESNKPKWSFIQWCLKNFYKPQLVDLTYRTRVLMRGEEPLDKPYYIGNLDLIDVNKAHVNRKAVQKSGD